MTKLNVPMPGFCKDLYLLLIYIKAKVQLYSMFIDHLSITAEHWLKKEKVCYCFIRTLGIVSITHCKISFHAIGYLW